MCTAHDLFRMILVATCATLLQACAFNGLFLSPEPIPATASTATLKDHTKKVVIQVELDPLHQPTFRNEQGEVLDMGYAITSRFFPNERGHMLHAWYITPLAAASNGATLLFFHGNSGNVTTNYSMMLPFVERGYSVLIPDYSGYGFSEGKATRRHVKEDGIAALKYLRGTGEDLGALILYGQSLGGHLAPCVAAEHQDLIDALVVEGAFSSHDDVAVALAKLGFFARWMTREMYSAKRSIAEFHKPVLVVHSREDATIPFAMGERLFGAANGPKTFLPIDQCHVCGPFYYPDSISDHMLRMVEGARGGTP